MSLGVVMATIMSMGIASPLGVAVAVALALLPFPGHFDVQGRRVCTACDLPLETSLFFFFE